MRVMPITQQNLNTKPCAINNQPNFKGTFVKGALGELDAAGSLPRRVIDTFGRIVEFGADKFLTVTARELKPDEPSQVLLKMCYHKKPELDFKPHVPNLRFSVTDSTSGKQADIDTFICAQKDGDPSQTIVNKSVFSLIQELAKEFPDNINLEALAASL